MVRLAEIIRSGQLFWNASSGVSFAIICMFVGEAVLARDAVAAETSTTPYVPVYPVKAGATNRYLVDQKNAPFMIVGDSPHSLIGRMSKSDAALYMTNRQRYGINTLWVELLCNDKTACNADGTTFDHIVPFTTPGDISTPNPAYFQRVDDVLRIAVEHGITLLLDAVETDGWLATFKANGPEKATAFGRYLGNRYKDVPNIILYAENKFAHCRSGRRLQREIDPLWSGSCHHRPSRRILSRQRRYIRRLGRERG